MKSKELTTREKVNSAEMARVQRGCPQCGESIIRLKHVGSEDYYTCTRCSHVWKAPGRLNPI